MNYWRLTTANRTKKIYSFGATDFFCQRTATSQKCQPWLGSIIFVNLYQDYYLKLSTFFRTGQIAAMQMFQRIVYKIILNIGLADIGIGVDSFVQQGPVLIIQK